MKKLFVLPAIAIALTMAACGGSDNKTTTTATEETTTEETASTETVPGVEKLEISNTIAIEGNDQMKFDKELFRVKAGEPIELTLKNVGTLPKESMGHNLVVLKPGVDVATFGGEATSAADNDYIPKTSLTSIAAHTKLLGPGEQDKITFTLDKGVYTFICSFPGHFGMMQGKIVAE
ncbi:azurin [Sphingobacterium sp. MYb382]|uniref:azurin n=1 Tax=Sphingobacterium sp. MYb382 TaxID=2745278 RepID=UPI00309F76AE